MPKLTIAPRIRSFICLNAHPAGCAANVEREIAVATAGAPGSGLKHALVIGASTGYGLSSLVSAVFGYGARGTAVCLERPAQGERTASAGYYNLAAVQRLAKARGKDVVVVNGDAFSEAVKQEVLARVAASGVKLDCVIYSLAAPKRTDEAAGVTLQFGAEADRRDVPQRQHQPRQRPDPAGGDRPRDRGGDRGDAQGDGRGRFRRLGASALLAADVLAKGCRAVAYSYIGPELTMPIYRSGTIGKAKEDLEDADRRAVGRRCASGSAAPRG